jgi:uncharacterized membrane protein
MTMSKGRLEAFSDGVIAILITIMVLELRTPHGADLAALAPRWPKFASYAVSFVFLGIYWNNHHHMLQATRHVDGRILWANMHLLFWLSLFPFATAWTGESHFAPVPVATYGVVQMLAAVAYFILSRLLVARHGADSALARAMGSDRKGRISLAPLRGGGRRGISGAVDLVRDLHRRDGHVARARQPDREGARRVTPSRRRAAKRAGPRPPAGASAPPATPPGPLPPLLRDPWAYVALAPLLLLVVRSLGTPFGEPVADDFDHLHHALFSRDHSWLGGGGSSSFWRPLVYEGYYRLLQGVIRTHPVWITVLHVVLLALVVVLAYDIARRHLPRHAAAGAAGFLLLLESTRALVIVPVHFVDLGLIVFSVLAWRAAAAGRLIASLAALLAALLCKETAVATAAILPWLAQARGGESRRRWLLATLAVTLTWAALYVWVRSRLAMALPHGLEARLSPSLFIEPARYAWAIAGTLRALMSLPMRAADREWLVVAASLLVFGAAAGAARHRSRRPRAARAFPRVRAHRSRLGHARHRDAAHGVPGVVARARGVFQHRAWAGDRGAARGRAPGAAVGAGRAPPRHVLPRARGTRARDARGARSRRVRGLRAPGAAPAAHGRGAHHAQARVPGASAARRRGHAPPAVPGRLRGRRPRAPGVVRRQHAALGAMGAHGGGRGARPRRGDGVPGGHAARSSGASSPRHCGSCSRRARSRSRRTGRRASTRSGARTPSSATGWRITSSGASRGSRPGASAASAGSRRRSPPLGRAW